MVATTSGQQGEAGPTRGERVLAMLAHLLALPTGLLTPLALLLATRDSSRFVAFHAGQAILHPVLWLGVISVNGTALFWLVYAVGPNSNPPFAYLLPSPFVLALPVSLGALAGVLLLLPAVTGLRACRGEWSPYPLVGALARRLLGP